ncbi:amino acid adenylation domain-containing protein [Micromonospora sp. KC606]|uniref:non-ribosomal peptide synthetase n=1 Tax=Micromonospora sp. KC606 TaxID=2530379 RepID=UPI001047162E|nr:non-ribosomal peptide synthetase [Micromonospora sp. KC606]TDC85040.1 amino acid adenylation domain-containing protein [Micromonospora sp. KC606]
MSFIPHRVGDDHLEFRDALDIVLREQGIAPAGEESIPRTGGIEAPLSFAQRRVWFFEQWKPGTPTYNVASAYWVDGPLDPDALGEALDALATRHEALRSRYVSRGGEPVQVIVDDGRVPLVTRDLGDLPAPRREGAALTAAEDEVRRPFDLGAGTPVRALLLGLSSDRHLLVLTVHHIAVDGLSFDVLLRDLDELYRACRAGQSASAAAPGPRYADVARWEHERWASGVLDEQVDYWRGQLSNAPDRLDLPTDRPRPPMQTFAGHTVTLPVPPAIEGRMRQACAAARVTPFVGYLAGFNVLVSRYAGTDDVVVGTPVATRGLDDLEDVVGILVNTVPLRTDLSGAPTFTDLLARVRDVTAHAYANQDVPFEKLIGALGIERALSYSPLVQVVFGMQSAPSGHPLGDARLTDVYVERGTAKFEMTWTLLEGPTPRIEIEFNTDLFDRATVDEMAACYLRLLEAALDAPEAPVTDVPMLPEAVRRAVLGEPVGTGAAAAEGSVPAAVAAAPSVPELVARRAVETPDAVAVTDGERQVTYAELDQRARQLASRLRRAGAGPETVVGLCLERSAEMIVALLAVFRAGAAYLPLDAAHPPERLAYMLNDIGARTVVSTEGARDRVPDGPWRLLDVADDASGGAADDVDDGGVDNGDEGVAAGAPRPGDLAYVIYTSGSTGRPKAVQVTHGNLSRLLSSTQDWFGFGPDDVWTMFHSYTFDFSVWEAWGALAYGGRLVVVPRQVARSTSDFHALLRRERVTVLNQTPSAFRQLEQVDREQGGGLALRWVVFGGEALDSASVARWFARHGSSAPRLVNMYGITETTVHVTHCPLAEHTLAERPSLIGVPIPDLRVYVLDRAGNPVPPGVPGELYVGGAGVARGYHGRPATTAERFVPDGFSGEPGARLYRTGDVGRRLRDGRLEYLGRNDDQVKIRGFRIETGEVEAAIRRHPQVLGAAVVAWRAEDTSPRLVAYVATGAALTTGEMREFLASTLPDYMLPAVFVFLDTLPMTGNGKVDHKALPEPPTTRPELGHRYVAPAAGTEAVLAAIWSEVLGVDRVGARDNFFDLGGDSIRSLQVLGRAKDAGLRISLQDLFRWPTVTELAAVAGAAQPAAESDAAVERQPFALLPAADRERLPEGVVDAYPMSVLQAGMVYHMRLDSETLPYHNVNSFHVRAPFDAEVFRQAVRDVVARHDILRTGFDLARFSKPMQLVHQAAEMEMEIGDLRGLSTEEQNRRLLELLHEERRRPFDIACPPLLRYLLHPRTDSTFQWTVTEHHAIFDGWSLFTNMSEVLERYLRLLKDPHAPADPPPASLFRDFIAVERESLTSPADREFWRAKLADFTPGFLTAWPAPPGVASDAGDTSVTGEDVDGVRHWRLTSTQSAVHRGLEALVPASLCDDLLAAAATARVPLKSVLLAAHLKVLGLATGRTDVVAGLTANGRLEEKDSTEVLGMFLNVPPIRVDLAPGTWRELVRRVFDAEQELLPHRRYPLAQIQWDRGGAEVFDNTFLYNHFHQLADVLGAGVGILDDKVESTAEFRSEPTSFALNTGFLRNPRSSQLLLRLDYYTERLSDEQAEAMRDLYLRVLAAMTRLDDGHDTLATLDPEQRRQVLVAWNGPARAYPVQHLLHELVDAQARRTPGAVAVVDDRTTLIYAELVGRANRLARHLRARGAGPETVVALCLPRDAGMVVGMLGVLKSGAAYLPLDPAYPAERLRFMLADAGAALVVTTAELADRVPTGAWGTVLVDRDRDAIDAEPDTAPAVTGHPDGLAYIMYTSGSTGTPKGVLVPHRGVVNYLGWAREAYACRGDGGAAVFSSYAFDMIVPNIYTPLIMGQRVCVLPDGIDPTTLGRRLERLAPFSFLKLTPGHLALLADTLGPGAARRLAGTLAVGADAFPARTLAAWRRLDPDTVLLNEYGPTEASVGNCVFHADGPGATDLVPIGRPIPNTTMYVLDAALNPVPVGAPGELYIGGDCVVRGYAGRAALTAERFLPDPFSDRPGARMYRTGDLGRWLPGGQLDFLGRIDEQVKINGYRVEPGEIEATLAQHPAVHQAVAAVTGTDPQRRALVGYYVAARPVDAAELRAFLSDRLPSHLMPSALVEIDEIPLNANGKVDRAALVRPETAPRTAVDPAGEAADSPPSAVEQAIAELWAELLETDEPPGTADFFEYGGNSLLAAQLVARINGDFAVELPLATVYQARTTRGLAERVAAAGGRR